jgi:hypothetical protein
VNFICGGKGIEIVPVPVRSGRCSPFWRMSRIRLRYWYSSCGGFAGVGVEKPLEEVVSFVVWSECEMTDSKDVGAMVCRILGP